MCESTTTVAILNINDASSTVYTGEIVLCTGDSTTTPFSIVTSGDLIVSTLLVVVAVEIALIGMFFMFKKFDGLVQKVYHNK